MWGQPSTRWQSPPRLIRQWVGMELGSLVLLATAALLQGAGPAEALLGADDGLDIKDLDETSVERLLKFVLTEIQKLKVENRELDDCHGLEIGSVLRGKKQTQKTVTYSLTLKVQPTDLVSDDCNQRNATANALHPEICEAEVQEDTADPTGSTSPSPNSETTGSSSGLTLLRSACLQVEELQE